MYKLMDTFVLIKWRRERYHVDQSGAWL